MRQSGEKPGRSVEPLEWLSPRREGHAAQVDTVKEREGTG